MDVILTIPEKQHSVYADTHQNPDHPYKHIEKTQQNYFSHSLASLRENESFKPAKYKHRTSGSVLSKQQSCSPYPNGTAPPTSAAKIQSAQFCCRIQNPFDFPKFCYYIPRYFRYKYFLILTKSSENMVGSIEF